MDENKEKQPANDFNYDENKGDYLFQLKKRRRWWWLLLLLIPLLLLLLLLRNCGGDETNTPPRLVTDDDVIWSGDSLTKIVNNRVILLFSEEKPVEEFIKDFRKRYPDKDKYQLYVPDMFNDLPRVVLTLPVEELEDMSDRLPGEFVEYDLMVIPEAICEGGRAFSDPAFSDAAKSWYFDMISVQVAWDYTVGSPDVVVAIIDAGFDLNHPELKGKEIVKPYNAVYHNTNIFPDSDSHGTHVASTAVGMANNGAGSSGIAPGCKLMPIQVANENDIITTSSVVDGVLYAIKNGADVVNMSLGGVFNPLLALLPENMQEEIVRSEFLVQEKMWNKIFKMGMTNGKDMAFVMAGGNESMVIGIDPMKRVEGTVRVSAVQPDKRRAWFSNYGTRSDLSAPGVAIYNAVSTPQKFDTMSGTSMASPIVAGAYALMKSRYPSMKVAEITQLLQHTGIPSPSKVGNIINFAYAMAYKEGKPIIDNPVDGGRGTTPVDGGRGTTPVDGGRGTTPVDDGRGTTPVDDGRGIDPVYGGGNPLIGVPRKPINGDRNGRIGIVPKPPVNRPIIPKPPVTNPTTPDDDCPDCTEAQRRYEELMRQLDELKRNHPECY